jgi:hypothetical protein
LVLLEIRAAQVLPVLRVQLATKVRPELPVLRVQQAPRVI